MKEQIAFLRSCLFVVMLLAFAVPGLEVQRPRHRPTPGRGRQHRLEHCRQLEPGYRAVLRGGGM